MHRLPDVDALRKLMQSLAMLDAILSPEWDYRYFSFNCHWSPGEQMGSMRNGEGDHYFALFNVAGCWLKGFDHESSVSPFGSGPQTDVARLFDGVPAEFQACLTEPAFMTEETTFCIWHRYADDAWQQGTGGLSAADSRLLRHLDGQPKTYHDWASDYYERDLPLGAIESVYVHRPLDQSLLAGLDADMAVAGLKEEADEIGYPRT